MAAAEGCSGRRQFAVACGVLRRHVRADSAAAKMALAAARAAVLAQPEQAAPSTMLLMPGADVATDVRVEPNATPAQPQAQLTITYGSRVLVLDGFPADRAAELVRVAAASPDVLAGTAGDAHVARKASLQRFMDWRRERVAARAAPYAARPASSSSPACRKPDEEEAQDAGCWLRLGVPGWRAC